MCRLAIACLPAPIPGCRHAPVLNRALATSPQPHHLWPAACSLLPPHYLRVCPQLPITDCMHVHLAGDRQDQPAQMPTCLTAGADSAYKAFHNNTAHSGMPGCRHVH